MKKISLGLIGCGVHATRDLYPMLTQVPNIEIVSICDRNIEKVKKTAKKYSVNSFYTDYEEMIKNEKLEAVVIVGTPKMHYEIGSYCLEKGLHIFVEKPSALTVEKAKKLAMKADENNKFGQVGHFLRHSPALFLAKEISYSKEFGTPVMIFAKYFTNGPWEPRKSWELDDLFWTYMLVQGVHLVDISRHFMGEVIGLNAKKHKSKSGRPMFSANLQFQSGSLGCLSFNASSPNWQTSIDIVGDKPSFLKVDNGVDLFYDNKDNWADNFLYDEEVISLESTEDNSYSNQVFYGYYSEFKHFAECIRNNTPPMPDLWDEYKALDICKSIIESSETGHHVDMQLQG